LKEPVARRVATEVVDLLEEVDVERNKRKWLALALGACELRPEAVGYCPAIEKSGERVPECLPLEEIAVGGHPLKLLLQALVGLAAALAHSPQGRRRRRSRRRECRFDLRKDEGRVVAEGR
jgi:hypothetical protein